jgi:hypothetical protein
LSVRTVAQCQPDCKIRYDDWRAAAGYVRERVQPGDAIAFYPAEVRAPFVHYLGASHPRLLFPERWALAGGAVEGEHTIEEAAVRARTHPRVWLVTWWLPSSPARDALRRFAARVAERDFQGDIRIELYRPRTRAAAAAS